MLSLVERGGTVRSYHVAGSTVAEVIPIVDANVRKETRRHDRQRAALQVSAAHTSPAMIASTTARRNTSATRRAARPSTPTRSRATSSLFKRGMRGIYQHCKEKHLHRYLAEFDFRYNNRVRLGVNDEERAVKMVKGAQGKRLTYRTTDRA